MSLFRDITSWQYYLINQFLLDSFLLLRSLLISGRGVGVLDGEALDSNQMVQTSLS